MDGRHGLTTKSAELRPGRIIIAASIASHSDTTFLITVLAEAYPVTQCRHIVFRLTSETGFHQSQEHDWLASSLSFVKYYNTLFCR